MWTGGNRNSLREPVLLELDDPHERIPDDDGRHLGIGLAKPAQGNAVGDDDLHLVDIGTHQFFKLMELLF